MIARCQSQEDMGKSLQAEEIADAKALGQE